MKFRGATDDACTSISSTINVLDWNCICINADMYSLFHSIVLISSIAFSNIQWMEIRHKLVLKIYIHFYSAATLLAMQSAVIATAIPSNTRWYCTQMNEDRNMRFLL